MVPEGHFSLLTVGNSGTFSLLTVGNTDIFKLGAGWGRESRDRGSGGGNVILEKFFTSPGICLTHYYYRKPILFDNIICTYYTLALTAT